MKFTSSLVICRYFTVTLTDWLQEQNRCTLDHRSLLDRQRQTGVVEDETIDVETIGNEDKKRKRKAPSNPRKHEKQKKLAFKKKISENDEGGTNSGTLETWKYDEKVIKESLIKLIVLAELPFKFGTTPGAKGWAFVARGGCRGWGHYAPQEGCGRAGPRPQQSVISPSSRQCMMAIFHELIKDNMEVFMDDFSVFESSFDHCLSNLDKMLTRCEETNLVLNWEKCHFMVKEGIVLGHKISRAGIEVDKAKIEAISKLPHPTNVKSIRSFLGHAGFYRRFIKNFSKITRPMTQLLMKDAKFDFSNECVKAFETLKKDLTKAPIMVKPDWSLPFELMCDTNDYVVGAVLGQRSGKYFKQIYYASKTMTEAQENYTTTEKELLAVVFAFDKFRQYLVLSKIIIYTD
ncbi:putative nucleotidyltransferase, ribonuclease H [Tanacetum coccineum]